MVEPYMVTSGQTYELENIKQYFKFKEQELKRRKEEGDDEFDPNTFFTCPISQQVVSTRLVPNKRIKKACSDFRRDNPWAFEFDPREEYQQIKVWTNPDTPGQ